MSLTSPFAPLTSTILLGVTGVAESAMISAPGEQAWDAWSKFSARRSRYALLWAFYEQNLFSQAYRWADQLRETFDLYWGVRSVYSPAHRIGEFWPEHIYPGQLDPRAGDGSNVPSCAPIVGASDAARAMLATLWLDSRWSVENVKRTRFGSVMGDSAIAVDHDPSRRRCYLRAIHPGEVADYTEDASGNCKGYVLEKDVPDPRFGTDGASPQGYVTFREVCSRRGGSVVYETFLDGDPYDWHTYDEGFAGARVGPTWSVPYGFVPFVFSQHLDVGKKYGWGAYQPTLNKLLENDCLASAVADQVYTLRDAPTYFEGQAGVSNVSLVRVASEDDVSGGGKTTRRVIMSGSGKPHILTGALSIADAVKLLQELRASLTDDHPELTADGAGLSASAESRREARRKVEARVRAVRGNYDDAMVRAQMMALTIATGAYPDSEKWGGPCVGYPAFPETAYRDGAFFHEVGGRPVFTQDEQSRLEEEEQRGKTLKALTDAGVPLGAAMRRAGFPANDVAAAMAELAQERAAAVDRANAMGFSDMPQGGAFPAADGQQP